MPGPGKSAFISDFLLIPNENLGDDLKCFKGWYSPGPGISLLFNKGFLSALLKLMWRLWWRSFGLY